MTDPCTKQTEIDLLVDLTKRQDGKLDKLIEHAADNKILHQKVHSIDKRLAVVEERPSKYFWNTMKVIAVITPIVAIIIGVVTYA